MQNAKGARTEREKRILSPLGLTAQENRVLAPFWARFSLGMVVCTAEGTNGDSEPILWRFRGILLRTLHFSLFTFHSSLFTFLRFPEISVDDIHLAGREQLLALAEACAFECARQARVKVYPCLQPLERAALAQAGGIEGGQLGLRFGSLHRSHLLVVFCYKVTKKYRQMQVRNERISRLRAESRRCSP